jgi:SPP1 family predicted phage head-tail adaptor
MDSSKLDRLIIIQWPSKTRSESGQEDIAWINLDTVWAQYFPQTTGKKYYAASQIVAEADAIFRIRFRDDVSRTMRLLYDSQTYDIQDIREVERKEGLDLLCKVIREPE